MFFSPKKTAVGIDIGTGSVKVVELELGERVSLKTYGVVGAPAQLSGKMEPLELQRAADVIRALYERSHVSNQHCTVSFPNSAVFSSVIELPNMPAKDLASAVEFEAKKYVPLPLPEVDLDWSIIGKKSDASSQELEKILLTAVPKQITENYRQVFQLAGILADAGEIESLALIRSLLGSSPISCVIIDIGAKVTSVNLVDGGLLKVSRNLNIGGETITGAIATSLQVTPARAEQFKRSYGVSGATFIPETIKPVLTSVKNETKQLISLYRNQVASLQKVILVGGGSRLPGITGFFEDMGLPVELGNPFSAIAYREDLTAVLKTHETTLAVAVGLALR